MANAVQAAEQARADRAKKQELYDELVAKERELEQMKRETEESKDSLNSQIAEFRYEAQKASLDVRMLLLSEEASALTNYSRSKLRPPQSNFSVWPTPSFKRFIPPSILCLCDHAQGLIDAALGSQGGQNQPGSPNGTESSI